MNVDIINLLIDTFFKFSLSYLVIKIIQEVKILRYYFTRLDKVNTLDSMLILMDISFKIILYICFMGIMIWTYFNTDIYMYINKGGYYIDMV